MTEQHEKPTRPRGGRVAKRQAITQAARTVFGRDGYAYTSIGTIAVEADVSTRTIYNHFESKEQLFSSVLQESATVVADALTRTIERHLGTVTDLEGDLVALGCAWAATQADHADHFALSRQVNAEAARVPPAILDTWHEAGPERAERALAHHLRHLADQGLLHLEDATRAANHFIWLVAGETTSRSYYGAIPLDDAQIAEIVTAGVRAFLNGYLPRRTDRQ